MISGWLSRLAFVPPILWLNSGCFIPQASGAETRPNFVIIFTDNQGMNDVSCYGSDIPTPNFDRIGREGIRFENWYSASSSCTPSRFALLTGRYPNRSQDELLTALMFLSPKDAARGIRPHETTLASLLKERGYRTAIIGKWHLGHGDPQFLPTRHGFGSFYGFTGGCVDYFTGRYGEKACWYRNEELVEEPGYATELLAAEAVRHLERQKPGQSFFLYLPFNAPHYGKAWDAEKKRPVNILQPEEKYLRRVRHIPAGKRRDYAATVVALDDAIGQVLDTLNRRKLDKSTLVICLSDNGADVPHGGSNKPYRGDIGKIFDGGLRVPCVIRWPGRIKPGQTTRQLASTLDLFPTFCRLAGIKTDAMQPDGLDLSPLLFEGREFARDLFWQQSNGAGAFRRDAWKFVRSIEGDELLFNLETDPGETEDLAARQPDRLTELKASHASVLSSLTR